MLRRCTAVALAVLLLHPLLVAGDDLRYHQYDNCVNIGPYDPVRGPLQFEWAYNATTLQGRFSTPVTRGGFAEHDGFLGLGFQGDGYLNPTGRDNLFAGWPQADTNCIKTLYTNVSTYWHGYCLPDNATLAIPNCTYAALTHYNGTCRPDNMTIPLRCYCDCDLRVGCWGPEPSCTACVDGCGICAEGFAGSTCRIPVLSDVYNPDGANTFARLSFRRDLVNYGHTISAGAPQAFHLLWAYRHASMFHPTEARCADGTEANVFDRSPYLMVSRDTERVAIDIDVTDRITYRRRSDGSCRSAPIRSLGTPPVRHVYSANAATTLGTDWVSSLLHLGATYLDGVAMPAMDTIDMYSVNETAQQPMQGDAIAATTGTTTPLVWTLLSAANGLWGAGSPNYFLHYYAIALYTAADQFVTVSYRHSHAVRGWVDGRLFLSANGNDGDVDALAPAVNLTLGWHQFLFKQHVDTGDAYFRVKFSSPSQLRWAAQLPFRCRDAPCQHGGVCVNSQCLCPTQWSGERCETTYLWGEQFQNMRVAILLMV